MPPVLHIYKAQREIPPEQRSWRARIARNEKSLIHVFQVWVAALRASISEADVAQAILIQARHAFDHVFEQVRFEPVPVLEASAAEEALREFRATVRGVDTSLHLSFDLRDPGFQQAVDSQGGKLIREVTDETRRAISNVIGRAYRDGLHPYVVAPEIRSLIGLTSRQSQAVMNFRQAMVQKGLKAEVVTARTQRYADRMLTRRAKTIGRTETAFAMTSGRIQSYLQAQERGLLPDTAMIEWYAVQDDPAEMCYQLNGKRVPLGETFGGLLPPAHPNCLPGDSLVTSSTPITAATKRVFDGDLVVIRTSGGRKLSLTPNHPVLTPSGWVEPGTLDVGDHIVCQGVGQEVIPVKREDKQVPARIEDVAETFLDSLAVSAVEVPVSAPDFHGDGEGSEVATVGTNRHLGNRFYSARIKHGAEPDLVGAHIGRSNLAGSRLTAQLPEGAPTPTARIMGGSDLLLPLAFTHPAPFDEFGFASSSWFDAALNEALTDDATANAEFIRECLLGFAGEVVADEIVSVDVVPFHGFVYNLETEGGWYVADGVIVHNCRCSVAAVANPVRHDELMARMAERILALNARYGIPS